jgi:hypothetical protein
MGQDPVTHIERQLTDLRVDYTAFKTSTESGVSDAKTKAADAHSLATVNLAKLGEFATNYALLAQAGKAQGEHIETLKEKDKSLRAEIVAYKASMDEKWEKLHWRIILLLLGMLGTTIGWIATLVLAK